MILINGCLNNDRDSQRLLYKHYFGYAMSICIRYSQNYDQACEILNDGFMKVFTHIKKYDQSKSFEGWLKRIMINTAIDHYRKNKKFYNHDDVAEQGVIQKAQVIDQLSYEELLKIVQLLSPAYRTVFSLFVIDGYSHEEIAKKLGISVGASKSNLSKARNNLRNMLRISNKEVYEQYI